MLCYILPAKDGGKKVMLKEEACKGKKVKVEACKGKKLVLHWKLYWMCFFNCEICAKTLGDGDFTLILTYGCENWIYVVNAW